MSVTSHVDAHLSMYLEYKISFLCDGKAKLSILALGRADVYGDQLVDNLIFTSSEHAFCKDQDEAHLITCVTNAVLNSEVFQI